jgi:hypothetical protein
MYETKKEGIEDVTQGRNLANTLVRAESILKKIRFPILPERKNRNGGGMRKKLFDIIVFVLEGKVVVVVAPPRRTKS